MVYYFRLEFEVQIDAHCWWTEIRLELQKRIKSVKNYKHGGYVRSMGGRDRDLNDK